MNDKEKLFYIIEEKFSFYNSIKNDPSRFEKQKFELQTILYMVFDFLVKQKKEIRNEIFSFFESYEKIYADIISSIDNPNCSCRGRVVQHFFNHAPEIKDLLINCLIKNEKDLNDDFYKSILVKFTASQNYYSKSSVSQTEENQNDQEIEIQKIESKDISKEKSKNLAGTIVSLKNNEEYYGFMKRISYGNFKYKGFSILEKENELLLYFY